MTDYRSGKTGWELCSERVERLREHVDYPRIIQRIRDLRCPVVQTEAHAGSKHRDYDTLLAQTIGLFNKNLSSIQIVFQDWDSSSNNHILEDMQRDLANDRRSPLCFRAIEAVSCFIPTITCLTFEGIRSGEDHGLVLSILRKAVNVKLLTLNYRMDWAVMDYIQTTGDNVESRNLWRMIGDMERLDSLRMSCLPARDIDEKKDWTPDYWLPKLKRLDLCRVPMCRGLLHTIIETAGPEMIALAVDEYSSRFLPSLPKRQSTSLRYLTLAGINVNKCQEAMTPFLNAHLVRLDLSLTTLAETMIFLQQYQLEPIGFAGLQNIVVNLHNVLNEDMPERLIRIHKDIFASRGIALEIRHLQLDGEDI
jgi:hypothetical protein